MPQSTQERGGCAAVSAFLFAAAERFILPTGTTFRGGGASGHSVEPSGRIRDRSTPAVMLTATRTIRTRLFP